MALEEEISCFALTETWLRAGVHDAEVFDPSLFQVFRKDRDFENVNIAETKGGGVLLALKNCIHAKNLDISIPELPLVDILGVEIKVSKNNFIVIILIYMQPDLPAETYEILFGQLESLSYLYDKKLLILGDFNIREFKKCISMSTSSERFELASEFSNFFSLKQFNSIVNENNRLLDLVYSTDQCSVEEAQCVLTKRAIHHPILQISIDLNIESLRPIPRNPSDSSFNFRKANFNSLYDTLVTTNWDSLAEFEDVDEAVHEFYSMLNTAFRASVPIKKNSRNKVKSRPVWFAPGLNVLYRELKHAFKLSKKDPSVENINFYKVLRSRVKSETRKARMNYLEKVENALKRDPRKFWSVINEQKNIPNLPSSMSFENTVLNNPSDIVNKFSDLFDNDFSNQSTDENIETHFRNSYSFLGLTSISEKEIYEACKKCKDKMTTGPDNIPSFLVKDCASIFAVPLKYIFDLILTQKKFPRMWKKARIQPVFKKGNRSEMSNYRPISILSNFSKVFESILHKYISEHTKNLISSSQHGFTVGRSTVTNLVHSTQYISEVIDNSGQVDVIYTDLSKAFDRLDHVKLCEKLHHFGISTNLVQLINSYLSDRVSFVQYSGYKSECKGIRCGVPQGSVLGPLLFILYFHDLTYNLSCVHLEFADDLKIMNNIRSHNDCSDLQKDLEAVDKWCQVNNMVLNVDKCQVMTFTKKINFITFDYSLRSNVLHRPELVRDLGITFDKKLSFAPHVTSICSKAHSRLGFVIRNTKELRKVESVKLLFSALVRSVLEYGSICWAPLYNLHIDNLEKVQRKAVKFLSYSQDRTYPERGFPQEILLRRHCLLSLEHRRIIQSILFLHGNLNNLIQCPEIIQFIPYRVPARSTRCSDLFYLPKCNTNVLISSPIHSMINNFVTHISDVDIHIIEKTRLRILLVNLFSQ